MIYTHMGIIYKICKLYAEGEDRDDLKQEIIYQLWKSYPTYRGDSKFQSWMYRVALNTAMLGLRARKVKYTGLSDLEHKISDDPLEHQEEEARVQLLYRQIYKLKDLDKTIIFLYLEECSYDEIAEITGIREKLRAKLRIQNQAS